MYIEDICNENRCIGCGNCKAVCPTKAIHMVPNKEGFNVPKVNHKKCINCLKCERHCPYYLLKYKEMPEMPQAIIVQAMNQGVLGKSASGGVCTLLSKFFIEKKAGYVCGAVYDNEFNVIHIVSNDPCDVKKMQQSKYVQSDLNGCFFDIQNKLDCNQPVLVIGTPCQIYALKRYLSKDYDNLFCIDLVCHGVPSPIIQKEYIKYLENEEGNLLSLNNRHKKLYPHSYISTYRAKYENGQEVIKQYADDPMADAFFSHLSVRKTCFDCKFKTVHRLSDLTVGDFWFSEQFGLGEDLLGVNLCLIQSPKGKEMLEYISEESKQVEIDAELAIILNGGMIYSSCKENENRSLFFEELGTKKFNELVFKYDGISKKTRLKYRLRSVLGPVLRRTRHYNRQLIKSASIRRERKIPDNKKGLMYY